MELPLFGQVRDYNNKTREFSIHDFINTQVDGAPEPYVMRAAEGCLDFETKLLKAINWALGVDDPSKWVTDFDYCEVNPEKSPIWFSGQSTKHLPDPDVYVVAVNAVVGTRIVALGDLIVQNHEDGDLLVISARFFEYERFQRPNDTQG